MEIPQNSENIEQPKDYYHHHDDIEDLFDLAVHRDVSVDEPKQNSDNDESDND